MADEKIGKKKVLLVDDDPLFLRYLTRLFPRKEYEVVTVSSGKEAWSRPGASGQISSFSI